MKKRVLSLFLVLVLIMTLVPVSAFSAVAQEADSGDKANEGSVANAPESTESTAPYVIMDGGDNDGHDYSNIGVAHAAPSGGGVEFETHINDHGDVILVHYVGRGGKSTAEQVDIDNGMVRFGEKAIKVNYDFTDIRGTEGACLGFDHDITIPGNPTGIGCWVYAPEGTPNLWFRIRVKDGTGTIQTLDFTNEGKAASDPTNPKYDGTMGGVNWSGWKYLECRFDDPEAGYQLIAPFTLMAGEVIRVMAIPNTSNMNFQMGTWVCQKDAQGNIPEPQYIGWANSKGCFYVDNLQAVYGESYVDEPAIIASGYCGGDTMAEYDTVSKSYKNLRWTLDSEGTLTISGTGDMYFSPWTEPYLSQFKNVVIEDGVTSIAERAFRDCKNLASVTMPDSVTRIGQYAFNGCEKLSRITIGNGICSIENNSFFYTAFYENNSNWESGVLYIGNYLIDTKNTVSGFYAVKEGTKVIASYAFANCRNLTSVIVPDSVTDIGVWAFHGCDSLSSVSLGSGVQNINNRAFEETQNLTSIYVSKDNTNYTSMEGILFNKDKTTLVCYPNGKGTSYVIPDSVTTIGQDAFSYCRSLKNVTIPDSVTFIDQNAFDRCTGLTNVVIPDSVTLIENYAFHECESLVTAQFNGDAPTLAEHGFGNYTFYGCADEFKIMAPANNATWTDSEAYDAEAGTWNGYPIEFYSNGPEIIASGYCGAEGDNLTWTLDDEGTLTISGTGDMMNYYGDSYGDSDTPWYDSRKKISNVVITEGVTSIGDRAFYNCEGLTSVYIPDSVTSIGDRALYNCNNLTSVDIPDSVTSIGEWAFYNCYNLTSVDIPDSVTSIGSGAFCDCRSLASITIPDSVTSIGEWAFANCVYLAGVTIPDSVTSIGNGTFYGCHSLTSVDIPDSVTSIGDKAFCACYGLTSITIPNDVTSIGSEAFEYCSSLASITIPDSVTSIVYGTLAYCSSLESVDIPDSVTSIGSGAFAYCRNLTSVDIPDSVTSIGLEAFWGCSNLTNVTIPDSVTSIGEWAFANCVYLAGVTIPDSVASIGYKAFALCNSLTEINVSENNEYYCSVDGVLFNKEKTELIQYPCGKLSENYIVPDSVTSIGNGTFYGCHSLTSVDIPDSVTSIGSGAFYNCSSLASITIPDSVTSIGDWAFEYCSSLESITIPNSVTSIGTGAFYYCYNLADVYYSGSEEEWNAINIGACNGCLKNAAIHFAGKPICDHSYTATVTPPTCTEQGYTTYTCSICGDSYVADYVEAIGHNFVNGKCTECGVTEPVAREGLIVVSDERARAGEEVTVSVSVEENPGIMVMVLGFDYDKSKLEFIGYEDGLMSGWKVASKAVWIGAEDVTANGVILKLKFKVLEDVEDGEVKVSVLFAEGDIANHDEQIIMPEELDGSITVYTNIPGDINGDDIVNALDLVRLQRYITGEAVAVAASCDVNGDGHINAQDLVRLQRYLAGEAVTLC